MEQINKNTKLYLYALYEHDKLLRNVQLTNYEARVMNKAFKLNRVNKKYVIIKEPSSVGSFIVLPSE